MFLFPADTDWNDHFWKLGQIWVHSSFLLALLCVLLGDYLAIYLCQIFANIVCLLSEVAFQELFHIKQMSAASARSRCGLALIILLHNLYKIIFINFRWIKRCDSNPACDLKWCDILKCAGCRCIMQACILSLHRQWDWAHGLVLVGRVPESRHHLGQAALALNPRPPPFLPVLAARLPIAAAVCVCGFLHPSSHLCKACKHKEAKHMIVSFRVIKRTNIHR